MAIQLSIGRGRTNAQGETLALDGDPSTVRLIADAIADMAPALEAWWSPHTWRGSYRREEGWESASGCVIDVDHASDPKQTPTAPSDDVDALCVRLRERRIPGNLFHLTPHGCRVVFVFTEQAIDLEVVRAALRGACALVAKATEGLNYKVDTGTSCDVARFFYTPNAIAKGVQREAHVVQISPEGFDVEELARHAPAPEPVQTTATVTAITRKPESDYQSAVQKFNDEHPLDTKRHSQTCPICEHNGCFGTLPNDKQRWFCWSSNHTGVGVRSPRGYHGDSLDLFAHENGVRPIDVLIKLGYLQPRREARPAPESPPNPDALAPPANPNIVTRRGLRSNSFDTACTILEREAYPTASDRTRDMLNGEQIRFNEMTGMIEFGNWDQDGISTNLREIRDVDVDKIRRRVELLYAGGVDDSGNETGLKLSRNDVERAIAVVADDHAYHPVRDYLSGLAWDNVERLNFVPSEILGAADSELNRLLFRKTMISAVARAFTPGCKVDTMLVLQGSQGAMKSTFFKTLSSPWFVDTAIDINADATRAYQIMRRAWLSEWAELETLLKARDFSTVKAFLSSPEDTYIAKYGRHPITVKRSGIIVGTVNPMEFLSDETGARRFWIIVCGPSINLALAEEWRDGLWAEAVHAYRSGEQWWLSKNEESLLVEAHEHHRVTDAWEDVILPWAGSQTTSFTTGSVLARALQKPEGQWNRADEMRVSKILKVAGYDKRTTREGSVTTKKWTKVA